MRGTGFFGSGRHTAAGSVEGFQKGIVGGRADDGVRGQVVVCLEAADCFGCRWAVDAVSLLAVVAENAQDFLDDPDVGAAGLAGDEDATGEDLPDDVDRGADGDKVVEFFDLLVKEAYAAVGDGVADGGWVISAVHAVPDL